MPAAISEPIPAPRRAPRPGRSQSVVAKYSAAPKNAAQSSRQPALTHQAGAPTAMAGTRTLG